MIIAVIELIKSLLLSFLNPLGELLQDTTAIMINSLILKFNDLLPNVEFFNTIADKFESIASLITDILNGVCYFIPLYELSLMFQMISAWVFFKLVFAAAIRTKSLIPTMGA